MHFLLEKIAAPQNCPAVLLVHDSNSLQMAEASFSAVQLTMISMSFSLARQIEEPDVRR
jgi:hypothetical protein